MERKILKNSLDERGYAEMADYCNTYHLLIEQDSDYYYLITESEQVINSEIVSKGEEFILNKTKEETITKIIKYDLTDNVNRFYYNNTPLWLDKATRVGLKNLISDLRLIGETTIKINFSLFDITLSLNEAEMMLAQIEYYAAKCYNTTQLHIRQVNNLNSLSEVNAFDITKDYPEQLRF